MNVYTYSEARQKLASVLDTAELTGKVLIRRKDGSTFALTPESASKSPLDVAAIKVDISTQEIVSVVRKARSKARGWRHRSESRRPRP